MTVHTSDSGYMKRVTYGGQKKDGSKYKFLFKAIEILRKYINFSGLPCTPRRFLVTIMLVLQVTARGVCLVLTERAGGVTCKTNAF